MPRARGWCGRRGVDRHQTPPDEPRCLDERAREGGVGIRSGQRLHDDRQRPDKARHDRRIRPIRWSQDVLISAQSRSREASFMPRLVKANLDAMGNSDAPPALSVMLIVSDADAAVRWYKTALGAGQLWDMGGV